MTNNELVFWGKQNLWLNKKQVVVKESKQKTTTELYVAYYGSSIAKPLRYLHAIT